MYMLKFGDVVFPIAPEKIQHKIKNNNKTISLMNGQELNLRKAAGLTEITFDLLLPSVKYPFAIYPDGKFIEPLAYVEYLESLKTGKKAFWYRLHRNTKTSKKGKLYVVDKEQSTKMKVTLEDYTIIEDADNGQDIKVSISLKQYVAAQTLLPEPSGETKNETKENQGKKVKGTTYVVKSGDTLWAIAKKKYGSSSWDNINKIYNQNKKVIEDTAKKHGKRTSSNGHWIWAGTKLILP